MNLDKLIGLDRIVLSEEDFNKVNDWCNKNKDLEMDESINMPFLEGVIVLEPIKYNEETFKKLLKEYNPHISFDSLGEKQKKEMIESISNNESRVYFKIDEESPYMTVAKLEYDRGTTDYIVNMEFTFDFDTKETKVTDIMYKHKREQWEIDRTISNTMMIISNVTKYVSYLNKEVKVTESHVVKTKKAKSGKGGKSKGNKKRVVRIAVKTYSLYSDSELKQMREYNRHIESWTVRGHWRHYKNGKSVWIKPYVKGDGEIEGKEYRV